MTLIALTVNDALEPGHGYPVLIADILFSSDVLTKNVPTPTYTLGTNNLYGVNAKAFPIFLKQKLYIVNERLCVALGGNGKLMEKFLKQLKLIYPSRHFDDEDLSKFIDQFERQEGEGLIAIVLVAQLTSDGTHNFQVKCVGISAEEVIQSRLFGTVVAAGTGAKSYLELVKSESFFSSDISNHDVFLATNQSIVAHFLGIEVSTGETLLDYWGAGFEMIYHEHGRFVKLDKYTVIIMDAPFGNHVVFEAKPILAMMIEYEQDTMIVKTASENGEWNFAIPSILDKENRTITKETKPEENALLMSYIFRHLDRDNKKYYAASARPRNLFNYGESPVVFERDGQGRLTTKIDSQMDRFMLETTLNRHGIKYTTQVPNNT